MYRIIIILILSFPVLQTFSQGCSDAGICTIKSFKPGVQLTDGVKGIKSFGVSVGGADHNIFIISPYISAASRLGERFSIDVKLNFQLNTGNGISNSGFGDPFVNLNYHPSINWTITGGIKVDLFGNDDAEYKGKPLPLDYQTSLGTMDIIAGAGFKTSDWQFVLGYQYPLTKSENKFTPEAWSTDSLFSTFQNTFLLKRKSDVMFRVARPMMLNEKITFTPSLLSIYHVGDDEYFVPGEGYKPIIGSNGLTINASLFVDLKLGEKSGLGISTGFPILVRKVRPDGLTRSFVLAIEYQRYFF